MQKRRWVQNVQDVKYPIMIIKGGVDLLRTSASQVLMQNFAKTLGLCKHCWKRETKMLVECTKDAVWGNGYPLGHPNSLRSQTWKSKGILGEILEEIRNHHLAEARSMPWANIRGWQSQHRLPPPPSSHFNAHFPPIHVTTSPPIR